MKHDWKARLNKQNMDRAYSYLRRNGVRETCYKAMERLRRDRDEADYDQLRLLFVPDGETLLHQRKTEFAKNYKISILVPTFETPETFLRQMLKSVMNQSYDNWELCIADGSDSDHVKRVVMETVGFFAGYAGADRIRYRKLEKNKGIAENTNAALYMASGDYIGLLDHDDLLSPDALFQMVRQLNDGAASGIAVKAAYSDEDKVNEDLTHYFDYHKKPGFNLDLLRSNNYICHFFLVKTEIAREVGGFQSKYNGAQDYDFILRCVEQIAGGRRGTGWMREIVHVPRVLYHWRSHRESTAENPESKMYAYEAGRMAVEDHLKRLGIDAVVMHTKHLGFYRVKYIAPHAKEQRLGEFTTKEWREMTDEQRLALPYDYIMVLDRGLKPMQADWKEELFSHLYRQEVGAVGGKLYDKKRRVESAGYSRDEEGKLTPDFKGLRGSYSGYLHRACLQRAADGVDLDCIMFKKEALCFEKKLHLSPDYLTVYDPYAEFIRRK